MIQNTAAIVALALTVAGLVSGGAWWMSALFAQCRRTADSVQRVETLLLSELGGVAIDGTRHDGRQNTEREKLEQRVAALESVAKQDISQEIQRLAGLQP